MKRNLKGFSAILAASMITISAAATTMAADIVIVQDTNIDVQQGNNNKDTVKKDEEVKKTEAIKEIMDKENVSSRSPITNDYKNENGSEVTEQESEATTNETESVENNTFNEPNLTDDKETTEDEPILEEKSTEETTRKETENADNTSSDTNLNIDNTNYVEINNNAGTVYVNIYNGIGVDINNNGEKEADVSVLVDNEIGITDNETLLKTQESEDAEETKITEETTEETTEAPKRNSHSSSGRRSSSSKGKSTVLNTENKEIKTVDTEDVKSEKEKKVVCMTIGSNLMNINGEAVETDTSPYISNSYTLVPLRCISTVFDAEVEWDKNTKTAIIKAEDIETRFTINSYTMLVNSRTVMIPKAAEIKNGRTYVPLRALGESLNANVSWIPDSKSVLIIK